MRIAIRAGLAAALTAATLATGTLASGPAFAQGGGGEVIETGPCSQGSTWTVKVKPDNPGTIEAEFEVDSNVVGQTWKVQMTDNGARIFRGRQVTQGPSGSFDVSVLAPDQPGSDTVVGKAINPATHEVCMGQATL